MTDDLRLFDDFERTYDDWSGYSTPNFQFLNKSTIPIFSYFRSSLESWFANFKTTDKKRKELWTAFRSLDNKEHHSAFFELYLHALFTHVGFNVDIEPDWNPKKPDFLLTTPSGKQILLEATGIFPDHEFGWQKELENRVFDYIDENLNMRGFFLKVYIQNAPNSQPPFDKIKCYLQKRIDELDYDLIRQQIYTNGQLNYDKLPAFQWKHKTWNVEFTLFPKNNINSGTRPFGARTFGVGFSNLSESLKSKINNKSSKYGKLDIPYILAINSFHWSHDNDDVLDALIRQERYMINYTTKQEALKRVSNGVWYGSHGYQKKRMSAICIFNSLMATNFHMPKQKLWHHPHANYPLSQTDTPFNQMLFDKSHKAFRFVEGDNLNEILKISPPEIEE